MIQPVRSNEINWMIHVYSNEKVSDFQQKELIPQQAEIKYKLKTIINQNLNNDQLSQITSYLNDRIQAIKKNPHLNQKLKSQEAHALEEIMEKVTVARKKMRSG